MERTMDALADFLRKTTEGVMLMEMLRRATPDQAAGGPIDLYFQQEMQG